VIGFKGVGLGMPFSKVYQIIKITFANICHRAFMLPLTQVSFTYLERKH